MISNCTAACVPTPVVTPLPQPPPAYAPITGTAAPAPAAPVLSSMTPTSEAREFGSVVVNLTGTGFTSNSVVKLNGNAVPTTFFGDTRLQAVLPYSLAGVYPVLVADAGGNSNAINFEFYASDPPTISGVAPPSAAAGSTIISVNGTNFSTAGVILFKGNPVATTYVSSTQLRATVTGSAGAGSVQVSDRGGTSNTATFTFT